MARAWIITLILSIIGFAIAGIAYGLYWFRGMNVEDLGDLLDIIVFAGVYGEWIKWGLIIGIIFIFLTIILALMRL